VTEKKEIQKHDLFEDNTSFGNSKLRIFRSPLEKIIISKFQMTKKKTFVKKTTGRF
jgi:hypothetical protein